MIFLNMRQNGFFESLTAKTGKYSLAIYVCYVDAGEVRKTCKLRFGLEERKLRRRGIQFILHFLGAKYSTGDA